MNKYEKTEISAVTYKEGLLLLNECFCGLGPFAVVAAVPIRDLHFDELFNCQGVFVFEKVTDFFEAFQGLVRAALHNVVDYIDNVLVQVALVLLGLGVLENFLKLLVLSDGLSGQWVEEFLPLPPQVTGFYHFVLSIN